MRTLSFLTTTLLLSLTSATTEQKPLHPAAITMPAILADILPLTKQINIFAGLTRDVDPVSSRLSSPSDNTTLLAPRNAAMAALPRKPWEDPSQYAALGASAYEGADGEARAKENLARFVQAHVVPASPWKENEKVQTLGGGEVWFVTEGGTRYVMPGKVEVEHVGQTVGNGEVWVLKSALNYA